VIKVKEFFELFEPGAGCELLTYILAQEFADFLHQEGVVEKLSVNVNREALETLEKIQHVMNDESLEDPECFQKIEKIVEIFHTKGIQNTRHDWG